jgi:hypothetical protein
MTAPLCGLVVVRGRDDVEGEAGELVEEVVEVARDRLDDQKVHAGGGVAFDLLHDRGRVSVEDRFRIDVVDRASDSRHRAHRDLEAVGMSELVEGRDRVAGLVRGQIQAMPAVAESRSTFQRGIPSAAHNDSQRY